MANERGRTRATASFSRRRKSRGVFRTRSVRERMNVFRLSGLTTVGLLLCASARFGGAQVVPFSIRVEQGQTVLNVENGGTIPFAAPALRSPISARISITYRGTGNATISTASF